MRDEDDARDFEHNFASDFEVYEKRCSICGDIIYIADGSWPCPTCQSGEAQPKIVRGYDKWREERRTTYGDKSRIAYERSLIGDED